jgi:putative tricarboxylic transport membrane protein
MAVLAPLGGLAAALALLTATAGLDQVAREGQLGPAFWPRLVLAGLALVCALRLAAIWRRGTRPAAPVPAASLLARGRLAAAIGLILLYVLAVPLLGFPLTTAAFIAAFMRLGGPRPAASLATAAVGGTIALLYVFVKLVYLPLPKGAGALESATVALYRALGIF